MNHFTWLAAGALLPLALTAGLAHAQVSDDVVKIGILNDQSGVYADFGGKGSVAAAKMAIEDFGGTVLGKKIEIIDADHQNKPDVASNIARQWYDVDHVDAIMELTTSSVALAVQGLSKEKKKITMTTGAATTDLTGKACTPYGFHWAYDTHALAVGTGGSLVENGGKTWFFLTADYAFGYALEADVTKVVLAKGGKVLGSVKHPLGTTDYSSFLLQAQGSGAQVVGLANAGLDTANAIKAAAEFGIVQGGQRIAALLFTLSEVHGLGLKAAQGLVLTEGYYWDLDDKSRTFSQRYMKVTGRMPNMVQAGTYSAVLQYLKAVKAAGTDATAPVAKELHEMPVDDVFTNAGKVLPNGLMVHDHVSVPGQVARGIQGTLGLLQEAGDDPRRPSPSRPCRRAAATCRNKRAAGHSRPFTRKGPSRAPFCRRQGNRLWARMPGAVVAQIGPARRIVGPEALRAIRDRVAGAGLRLCESPSDDRARRQAGDTRPDRRSVVTSAIDVSGTIAPSPAESIAAPVIAPEAATTASMAELRELDLSIPGKDLACDRQRRDRGGGGGSRLSLCRGCRGDCQAQTQRRNGCERFPCHGQISSPVVSP